MNDFIVKYKNGSKIGFAAAVTPGDTLAVELREEIDYPNVEYVEYLLHAEEIHAGDDGY